MRSTFLYRSRVLSALIVSAHLLGWLGPGAGRAEPAQAPNEKPAPRPAPTAFHVHCLDGSTLKLEVREEKLEILTPYGKLQVPVGDIRRIEVADRVSED